MNKMNALTFQDLETTTGGDDPVDSTPPPNSLPDYLSVGAIGGGTGFPIQHWMPIEQLIPGLTD